MHRHTRHLRGLLVALAALALSAGVVLAARPASVEAPGAAAADGLTTAAGASGKTVPVLVEEPAAPTTDEDAAEVDGNAPETQDPADAPTTGTTTRKQNHGWFVSQAAKAATAAALAGTATATHGQTVSAVAQSDLGKPAAATAAKARAATAAAAGKAHKPAKSH